MLIFSPSVVLSFANLTVMSASREILIRSSAKRWNRDILSLLVEGRVKEPLLANRAIREKRVVVPSRRRTRDSRFTLALHPRAIETMFHPRVTAQERSADTLMHESVERDNLCHFTRGRDSGM